MVKRATSSGNRSPALKPIPENLSPMLRLVNLLPKQMRRSSCPGIHELTMRNWQFAKEDEAAVSWFYMWRYIAELPLTLQAFVLNDDHGRLMGGDYGPAWFDDINHCQPDHNIELPGLTESELELFVSTAKERIEREIEIFNSRGAARSVRPDPVPRAKSNINFMDQMLGNYRLGDLKYHKVGPSQLLRRAGQRFFFILAADEIFYALTSGDPDIELTNTWYANLSGATGGHLYVAGDRVEVYPSVLFFFFEGAEVSRIRRCHICDNYFWAGRKDKLVCSEKCGARARNDKEKERYMEIKLGDRKPKKRKTANRTDGGGTGVRSTRSAIKKGV